MAVTQEIGLPIDLTKGTFVNTEIKDGKLQLRQLDVDDSGNAVFVESGYWESEIINIKDKITSFKRFARDTFIKGNGTYIVYTKSSKDKITWTDYVEINYSDNSILSPVGFYAMVKIEIAANKAISFKTIDEFNSIDKYNNPYVESANSVLKLKKQYTILGEKDATWTSEGKLFHTAIANSKFKRIDSLALIE